MKSILSQIDFGNEAGDDVSEDELDSYFVEQAAFAPFLGRRSRFLVAHARKGVGKSNLLQWVYYKISAADKDAIVIKCRGADVVRSVFGLATPLASPNEYIRDWMVRLCSLINRNIGTRINIALTDDKISLVEAAELQGYKSRNLVGCLLDRFRDLLSKIVAPPPQKLQSLTQIIQHSPRATGLRVV